MTDCIFCKIINGDIPSYKIYEDDYTYAFLDISQVAKGHTLVVPKSHAKDILDVDSEQLAHVIQSVQHVAKMIDQTLKPDGINILQNNRSFADQSVFHLHFHIMPRYQDDIDGFGYQWETHQDTFDSDQLKSLQNTIINA